MFYKGYSDIFGILGPLRLLQKFALSEWQMTSHIDRIVRHSRTAGHARQIVSVRPRKTGETSNRADAAGPARSLGCRLPLAVFATGAFISIEKIRLFLEDAGLEWQRRRNAMKSVSDGRYSTSATRRP